MFSFMNKRSGDYPSESRWSILQGQNNGKPMFVRRNNSVKQLMSGSEFRYRVGIAIPFPASHEDGLPSNEEIESLNQIEDQLSIQLEKDQASIEVLSITTGGMREFVFYTRDPEMIEAAIHNVRSRFSSHAVQFYVEEDKMWSVYRQFAQDGR